MTDFEKIQSALEKSGVRCNLRMSDPWGKGNEYDVIVGMDAPDRLIDKVFDALEKAGFSPGNNVGISGDMSGPGEIRTIRINGGAKNYW